MAKNAWWNEIGKIEMNEAKKRVFLGFCSMFSLFEIRKIAKTMQLYLPYIIP